MQGRFDPDVYEKEVVDVAVKLVPMTIALWNKVQGKMLPTPAKFHYLFNMRELSKVRWLVPIVEKYSKCFIFRCLTYIFLGHGTQA